MPEQIACPSCGATLRVPETLLGKNVKCPKCQKTFRAEAQAAMEPEEPEERVAREPAPARASSRRPQPPPEEYEDEAPPPDEDEDEDRPRRGRRGGSAAASAVMGPAISMMVVGGLDIVFGIVDILLRILGVSLIATGNAPKGGPNVAQQSDTIASMAGGIGGDILSIALAVLIIVGALKMKNLSSFGLAMTACVISIIPCHACCCLGIPFGIWGIVMLNKPEVKEAFGRNR